MEMLAKNMSTCKVPACPKCKSTVVFAYEEAAFMWDEDDKRWEPTDSHGPDDDSDTSCSDCDWKGKVKDLVKVHCTTPSEAVGS